MSELKAQLIRVAHSLPVGNPRRQAIAHLFREEAVEKALRTAGPKDLPPVMVQGYKEFTNQIRALSTASAEIETLKAELEVLGGDRYSRLKNAEKAYKENVELIKKTYKENLEAQGRVVIERKTSLVEARIELNVIGKDRPLASVEEEMIGEVLKVYGSEVADFVRETNARLQKEKQTIAIMVKGFSLESRAEKTASQKRAFSISGALAAFRDFIMKGWKILVSEATAATQAILGGGAEVEKAHNNFMKVVKSLDDR